MAELKADVLVLGAGMVGVGAALHLQKRGRNVVLIDRHELAGEETSYGNGGLIECASVFPYMFPRDFRQILQYASNRTPQMRRRRDVLSPWTTDRVANSSRNDRRASEAGQDAQTALDRSTPSTSSSHGCHLARMVLLALILIRAPISKNLS